MSKVRLTKGRKAIVCECHKHLLGGYKWYYKDSVGGYAARSVQNKTRKPKTLLMHRVIIGAQPNQLVDHINRNKLDNRCSNLRIVTNSQNVINSSARANNSSGYKGVTWHKKNGKWQASVMVNYKRHHLGQFTNVVDAARVYNDACRKYFGDFAYLNKVGD